MSKFQTHLHTKSTNQELYSILRHEWWQRVWVIQEAVVSKNFIVERVAYSTMWQELSRFIFSSAIMYYPQASDFASAVRVLRASLLRLVWIRYTI